MHTIPTLYPYSIPWAVSNQFLHTATATSTSTSGGKTTCCELNALGWMTCRGLNDLQFARRILLHSCSTSKSVRMRARIGGMRMSDWGLSVEDDARTEHNDVHSVYIELLFFIFHPHLPLSLSSSNVDRVCIAKQYAFTVLFPPQTRCSACTACTILPYSWWLSCIEWRRLRRASAPRVRIYTLRERVWKLSTLTTFLHHTLDCSCFSFFFHLFLRFLRAVSLLRFD